MAVGDRVQSVPQLLVVDLLEIDAASLVEEDVCGRAHDLVLFRAQPHLVIVEVIPIPSVQRVRLSLIHI